MYPLWGRTSAKLLRIVQHTLSQLRWMVYGSGVLLPLHRAKKTARQDQREVGNGAGAARVFMLNKT